MGDSHNENVNGARDRHDARERKSEGIILGFSKSRLRDLFMTAVSLHFIIYLYIRRSFLLVNTIKPHLKGGTCLTL